MRILVIGGGAIGRMLVHQLQLTQHDVALVARENVVKAIRDQWSTVCSPDGYPSHLWIKEVYTSIANAFAGGQRYDLIVIAVKSYDTNTVARELAECRESLAKTTILTVQNGIGNEEALSVELPGVAIIAGAITTPVEAVDHAEIRILKDQLWIGLAEHTPYAITELTRCVLEKAGFTAKVFADARSLKWSKLLMNIMGNATSAILGWTPKQVFADARLGKLEIEMIREALAVMQSLTIPIAHIGGTWIKWTSLLASLVRHTPMAVSRPIVGYFVANGRGGKMPSLYYDVHPSPRGKSEVGWLNGVVANEAAKQGLRAPINTTFARLLGVLTKGHEPPLFWQNGVSTLLEAVDKERDNEPTNRGIPS